MSTPRKATTAITATPEKPAMSMREVEDIRRGELYHGAGDASPKDRAARQKAEQRIRVQQALGADNEMGDSSASSSRARKGGRRSVSSPQQEVEMPSALEVDDDLARAPSPTPSTKTVVAGSPEPEPPLEAVEEELVKLASFVTAPEAPSPLVSAAPSLVIQPGGLPAASSPSALVASPLSRWEKLFFTLCVTPVILAAAVKVVTTSKSSYFEISAMSRDSARTISALLHDGIDSWLVPFARLCLDLFEECIVPLLHVGVNLLTWMVANAMQLLLVAAIIYTGRTALARRRVASAQQA